MKRSFRLATHRQSKLHWYPLHIKFDTLFRTRCGKSLLSCDTTNDPAEVTCLTCRKFLAYWADKEGQ